VLRFRLLPLTAAFPLTPADLLYKKSKKRIKPSQLGRFFTTRSIVWSELEKIGG
jgi:hypothetical protein